MTQPPDTTDTNGLADRLAAFERRLDQLEQQEQPDPMVGAVADAARIDRRWREHLLQGVRGLAPIMAVDIQGTLYFFDTSDTKSGRTLFVRRGLRRDHGYLARAVDALGQRGVPFVRDLFLDIGAHIGTTTLYAVRHLGFAEAVAVEPSIQNLRLLRLSVLANGLEGRVRSVRAAVSDGVGVSQLDVDGVGSEYHRLVRENGDGGDLRELVPTTTLDALAADGIIDPERVGMVWMDVEGSEVHVLTAARSVLDRSPPLVLEVCGEKLAQSGGLAHLSDVIQAHYTHIFDLRKDDHDARFVPAGEIETLVAEYEGHCFDALACRLPGD